MIHPDTELARDATTIFINPERTTVAEHDEARSVLDALASKYSYCGSPEPTQDCETHGYCDYHLGATPPEVPVGHPWPSKPFPE